LNHKIFDFINFCLAFQDESGGYISADHIKKEVQDPSEIGVISTVPVLTSLVPLPVPPPIASDLNQPLPPGED